MILRSKSSFSQYCPLNLSPSDDLSVMFFTSSSSNATISPILSETLCDAAQMASQCILHCRIPYRCCPRFPAQLDCTAEPEEWMCGPDMRKMLFLHLLHRAAHRIPRCRSIFPRTSLRYAFLPCLFLQTEQVPISDSPLHREHRSPCFHVPMSCPDDNNNAVLNMA